jgi:hypothetical protein
MKKKLSILTLMMFAGFIAKGQDEKSPTVQFLNKRGYSFQPSRTDTLPGGVRKWPDTLYFNTIYKSRLLGTPTIPISFTKIDRINGAYQVNPTISLGYGYAWFFGNFTFSETDKILVDPKFFFGLIADFGLQNDFSLNKLASVFTGGFIGFASYSLFFGYDYISRSPTIGLGGRVDLYTVHQNSLNPIGKVAELRKHKVAAVRIEDE